MSYVTPHLPGHFSLLPGSTATLPSCCWSTTTYYAANSHQITLTLSSLLLWYYFPRDTCSLPPSSRLNTAGSASLRRGSWSSISIKRWSLGKARAFSLLYSKYADHSIPGTLAAKDLWKLVGSTSLLPAAGLAQHSSAIAAITQPKTNSHIWGHHAVLPDQIAFSKTYIFAFKHSALPCCLPLYLFHGDGRHEKVKLFSNCHDTALFRYLHKQPDFSEV